MESRQNECDREENEKGNWKGKTSTEILSRRFAGFPFSLLHNYGQNLCDPC